MASKPLKLKLREITLPGGDLVTVSDMPEGWWDKPNASGYIDPSQIAPDLKNPRRVMNPARRAELRASIKSNGVRQALVVTPRHFAPWAEVGPQYKSCYFLNVSGHRRQDGALAEEIGAVPIMVRVYPNEKLHRMDVSLLNKGQDDLSPLEEGHEILMLQGLDWKVAELCDAFGYAAPQLYDRMHLTRLDPNIQKLLDPDLPRKKRLGITLGGSLGGIPAPSDGELEEACIAYKDVIKRHEVGLGEELEGMDDDDLRFGLQRLLLAVIQKRDLSSERATQFIMERKLQLSSSGVTGRPTQRFKPTKRKEVLSGLIKEVMGSVVVDWLPDELKRVFDNASREEVEEVIVGLQSAGAVFTRTASVLERVRDGKKATNPEVAKLMELGKAKRAAAA
jgi:hypothetical protein